MADGQRTAGRSGWGVAGALGALAALPPIAIILLAPVRGRAAYDMLRFHVPVIERFSEALPAPDLSDYLSATTPGFHLALALAHNGLDLGVPGLRLAGAGVALVFGLALGLALGRRTGEPLRAVALGAPAVASAYVALSGAFVLPDVAGWLGVLGVLAIALRVAERDGARPRWLLAAGVALLALALVRQIHLWSAAALWTAAWWSAGGERLIEGVSTDLRTRLARALLMLLATLPAFAVVGAFVWAWGGLTPPMFQGQYPPGINPAGPAFVLALTGALGVFFAGWWAPGVLAALAAGRERGGAVVGVMASILGAGAVALVVATEYDKDAGRWSGLWNLAQRLPAPGGRSVVILGLAMLGGLTIWAVARRLSAPTRWTLLAGGLAFMAALSAGHELWQRYAEPMVLLWLALGLSASGPSRDVQAPRLFGAAMGLWRVSGPAVLAAGSLALAATQVWRAPAMGPIDPDAPLPWAQTPADP